MGLGIVAGSIIGLGIIVCLARVLVQAVDKEVQPQSSICRHCKFCLQRWSRNPICHTSEDEVTTNYITGGKVSQTFQCARHNLHGSCPHFKKVWWKR
jgi:hypothetical protein